MKTVSTINAVIFAIVCVIAIYLGLSPRKWQTWLLSLYGFLTFFLVGIVGTGSFYEATKLGAIVTFALIGGGIITYWNRERAKWWLNEHEADASESINKLDMRTHSSEDKSTGNIKES